MKKIIYLFTLMLLLIPFSFALANDTDVYVLDQTIQQVPPDILMVLDLSGSMRYTPAGSTMYIAHDHPEHQNCGDNVAYYPTPTPPYDDPCTMDVDLGTENPDHPSMFIWGESSCTGPFYRYNATGDDNSRTPCSRLAIAKRAIKTILDYDNDGDVDADDYYNEVTKTGLNMRMGYMRFYGCDSYSADSGTDYTDGCNRLIDEIGISYSPIWTSINNANAFNGTHLAYSLNEAKLYLDVHKGNDDAKACRRKFVILITDGEDTLSCRGTGSEGQFDQYKRRRETIAKAKLLADAGYKVFVVGFGAQLPPNLKNTLNWAAYYGGTDNTGVANSITGTYNILSGKYYPQGISSCSGSTYNPGAQNISGYAYFAGTPAQLEQALTDIKQYILGLIAESTSYVAPVVPISQMESTSSMNRMYLAMFKPTVESLWNGNIKKFGIANAPSGNIEVGDVIDANGMLAITPQNEIDGNALSYWSTGAPDHGEVTMGGVGQRLQLRDFASNPRNIYTYLGGSTILTLDENKFRTSNTEKLTYQKLGLPDDTKRESIIKFVHGYDCYNWNVTNPQGPTEKRDWILGAFIHSRPLVIHYSSKTVIYAGANDGMLHAFDDATGEELWAFIPPSLLPKLQDFETNNILQIFSDGSPRAYIERDTAGTMKKAIIIFGLRRGGDRYIALDVSQPDYPALYWEIAPPTSSPLLTHEVTTGFERLNQTWSTPVIRQVRNGTGKKVVAFFAGGYDPCNDPNQTCGSSDQKGNAVYAIDITDGHLLWSFSKTQDPAMTYSIPSDITAIDITGDDLIDRLYVGDLGGQLWRFDIGNLNDTAGWTGRILFKSNQSSSEKRKIFYPPDVSFEADESDKSGYEWVYFGTGDRENPKQETGTTDFPTQNRLYAIKDKNPSSVLTETNLVDVTDNILQKANPTATEKAAQAATLLALASNSGWFITLENKGEKALASPVIFSETLYYTTFTPSYPTATDVCFLGEGKGRVYAVQYRTGMAAFNLDLTNDADEQPPTIYKSDRSISIGAGIPSQVVIAVVNGELVGYIGVGGGVFSPEMGDKRVIIPLYWRTVF